MRTGQVVAPRFLLYDKIFGLPYGSRRRHCHTSFMSPRRLRAMKRDGLFTIFVKGTFGGTVSIRRFFLFALPPYKANTNYSLPLRRR